MESGKESPANGSDDPKAGAEAIEIPMMSLYDMLSQATSQNRSVPALVFYSRRITYQTLLSMVDSFAEALRTRFSVRKGDRIAIFVPNSPPYVISLFAIMKIGAIPVPVNSTSSPSEVRQIHHMSDFSGIITVDSLYEKVSFLASEKGKFVIVSRLQDFVPLAPALSRTFESSRGMMNRIEWNDRTAKFSDFIFNHGDEAEETDPAKDIAVLQYTGGITGTLNGASLSYYNLMANIQYLRKWLPRNEKRATVLAVIPFYHVYSLIISLLTPLSLGYTVIIIQDRNDLKEILTSISKYRPDYLMGTPSFYSAVLNRSDLKKYDYSSLKFCISGGDKLPQNIAGKFEEATGVGIIESYGLVEASGLTHINAIDRIRRKGGSIGLPVGDTKAEIIDQATGEPAEPGDLGELMIQGPQIMTGYYGNEEETAEVLEGGWLHTGDIAKKDGDGYFYIVGRKKDVIISEGSIIFPKEVEDVLYLDENVKEAAIIGIPDEAKGEVVKAYIAPKEGKEVSEKELRHLCKENLALYKRPAIYEFRDELPKSMSGKIIRRILKEEMMKEKKAETEE